MKLRTFVLSLAVTFSLAACNDEKDYSGAYININNPKISLIFQKSENGDYQLTSIDIIGKNSLTGIIKNGIFYRLSDNEKVGKFEEDKFIDTNGIQYKK
ncbi:hypothetical protein [Avibacterium paragallinarum]|uniref:Lipoprotein n=1 Tax=Avibacterium paragallinarum TaxID=728 RepID=A0ABU7QS75_AVIPA|nr:hypothetical protein [Avibacterium paragallinarum]